MTAINFILSSLIMFRISVHFFVVFLLLVGFSPNDLLQFKPAQHYMYLAPSTEYSNGDGVAQVPQNSSVVDNLFIILQAIVVVALCC